MKLWSRWYVEVKSPIDLELKYEESIPTVVTFDTCLVWWLIRYRQSCHESTALQIFDAESDKKDKGEDTVA